MLLQLLTSFTATGLITFTVTHLHYELVTWSWWFIHWLAAWPLAFAVIRWLAPVYKRILER